MEKPSIVYRVINNESNHLKKPYILLEDLAIIFGEIIKLKDGTIIFQRIDEKRQKEIGISTKQLWLKALEETQNVLPERIQSLKEIGIGEGELPLFRITNEEMNYGASVILYPNVLEEFSVKYGYNLFILPLSVHEVIIMFDSGEFSADEIHTIVKESNKKISKEEFLSDNVYYYNQDTKDFYALF